jgi:TrfB plasmid transcriptional repressor
MVKKSRISAKQFERVLLASELRGEQAEMARRVMVLGEKQSAVALEFGVTRQWVNQLIRKLRDQLAQLAPLPKSWVRDVVELPVTAWPEVRAIEQRERTKLSLKTKRRT